MKSKQPESWTTLCFKWKYDVFFPVCGNKETLTDSLFQVSWMVKFLGQAEWYKKPVSVLEYRIHVTAI